MKRDGSGRPDEQSLLLPIYGWVCLAVMFFFQMAAFCGTRALIAGRTLHDLSLPLDGRIPLRCEWVSIYVLSYVSWAVSALRILPHGKARAYRVASVYIAGMLMAAATFLIWPGTIQRPGITGGGLWAAMLRWIYRVDPPTSLCPSLHVMVSFFCWWGTWDCPGIGRGFRWFNGVFLILVCLSVLLVKQHAVVDVIAGLAEGALAIPASRWLRLEGAFEAAERRLGGIFENRRAA